MTAARQHFHRFISALAVMALAGCQSTGAHNESATLNVVTTTGILADLVRNVAGPTVNVSQMIPDAADPHSFEPSLRAVRDVAYADVAFTNYLLLEQHSIIRTLDANLPKDAVSVSIAEQAAKDGAVILPLVEDRSLDTAWLGMRVSGEGKEFGFTRSSEVDLSAIAVNGPGISAAYLTTTFGAPEIAYSSDDGFNEGDGYASDTMTLPADAHTHLSWAFSEPGIYRVTMKAAARATETGRPVPIPEATAVFAVGVDPSSIAKEENRRVFSAGHGDITVDLDSKQIMLHTDMPLLGPGERHADTDHSDTAHGHSHDNAYPLSEAVIEVPSRTLAPIPASPGYRFIGRPGQDAYILPQAVLGKHVHGDIDPHLWHDVHNAAAYVRVIRDTLAARDPAHAEDYRQRASAYLDKLEQTDATVAQLIAQIPADQRHLVTTHDAYGYLANAYGLNVAGFVAPHPGSEPSIKDRQRLAAALRDLNIPAVFLEPQLANGRSTVATIARESGVEVCPLYGDTLDRAAPTYIDMMLFNAHSLNECLRKTKDHTP